MTGTHGAPRDDAARAGDDAAHPPLDLATVRADLPDDVEIAMIWAQTTAGVIGDGADIGARCELLRGARVWPGVTLPDGGVRFSTDV